MANCKNTQQLNITCGTDVVLHDRLIFEGETFDPNLSVGIAANLVTSLGKRTALDVQVVDDELLISVPWIDGTLPGCYGLEVTGSCNSKKWATYADSLIKYTKATRIGVSEVTVESDSYDITQEVGYCYSNSPVTFAEVTVDEGYGTPSVDVEYEQRVLSMEFHNLKGNGITDIDVDEQVGDEAVNTVTIKTDADQEGTEFKVRNGRRGNGIASSSEVLSPDDGGINTHTITDTDGNEHVFHTKNGSKGEKGDQGDSAVYDPSSPDAPDFVMANTTGQSTTKAMTQKAVTDELDVRPYTDDTEPDLAFADDEGNEIAQFANGHIKTQKFDSEKTVGKDDEDRADLSFTDEQGNMIARFADGHVQTKNFNSEEVLNELNDIKTSGSDYGIMLNLAAKMYVRENPFGLEANTLYKDGALRMGGDVAPLFIVGGQSNADGRAPLSQAPSWLESDYTLPNYMMWTGSTFADYNIQTNNGHWPTFDTGKDKFAMDLFFAHKWLVDNPGKKIYCIKNTMGDTGIQDQPTTGDHNYTWQPKLDTIVEGCNSLFVVLINKMIAVHRWAVSNKIKLVPIAILWHQGEHDAGVAWRDYFEQNIKNVISFFRGLCAAPALPFLTAHTMGNTAGYAYVDSVYDTLPPLDAYTKVVNMDGHLTSIGDNLHFDGPAHEYMGEQMYAYWKSLNV